jgi:hypothetical protein
MRYEPQRIATDAGFMIEEAPLQGTSDHHRKAATGAEAVFATTATARIDAHQLTRQLGYPQCQHGGYSRHIGIRAQHSGPRMTMENEPFRLHRHSISILLVGLPCRDRTKPSAFTASPARISCRSLPRPLTGALPLCSLRALLRRAAEMDGTDGVVVGRLLRWASASNRSARISANSNGCV